MIIIPARLASTRFPEKILAQINGVPMVVATAKRVGCLDEVVVATDSKKVQEVCTAYNLKSILTLDTHESGTDRINEAATKLNLNDNEIIINVQADEPFIEKEVVQGVIERVKSKKSALITSCYKKISHTQAKDPNLVKVVVDKHGYAIYFSRSKIPYDREDYDNYLGHLGIYGFTCKGLKTFCSLKPSILEKTEKLEQLRALENGYKIAMLEVQSKSFGIDTKEDLEKALKIFSKK